MNSCNIVILLLGFWAIGVSVWCLVLDSRLDDKVGWLNKTETEIDYIRRRHPNLWGKITTALAQRYLDEGDATHA